MNRDPIEQELSDALTQEMETASPGFTAAVLAQLEERQAARPIFGRPALAVVSAVLVLVIGIALGLNFGNGPAPEQTMADDRELLLREYSELQRELEQIQQLAVESGPVLYLGGDETLDVVYDLREYQNRLATSGVRPASLPPDRG